MDTELSEILSLFVVETFTNDLFVDWTLTLGIEMNDDQVEECKANFNVELVSALLDKFL